MSSELHSYNHLSSFNHLINKGVYDILADISPTQFLTEELRTGNYESIEVSFVDIQFGNTNQTPFEARLTNSSYSIDLFATIKILINKKTEHFRSLSIGEIPLMVLSDKCLVKTQGRPLHKYQEDNYEVGGFFIVNGLEKILRNIIIPKKNFPLSVVRQTFQNRQSTFTKNAVMIKSVRPSYRSQTLYLHYTTDDLVVMSIMIRKVEYLFPLALIVKALVDIPDL